MQQLKEGHNYNMCSSQSLKLISCVHIFVLQACLEVLRAIQAARCIYMLNLTYQRMPATQSPSHIKLHDGHHGRYGGWIIDSMHHKDRGLEHNRSSPGACRHRLQSQKSMCNRLHMHRDPFHPGKVGAQSSQIKSNCRRHLVLVHGSPECASAADFLLMLLLVQG